MVVTLQLMPNLIQQQREDSCAQPPREGSRFLRVRGHLFRCGDAYILPLYWGVQDRFLSRDREILLSKLESNIHQADQDRHLDQWSYYRCKRLIGTDAEDCNSHSDG